MIIMEELKSYDKYIYECSLAEPSDQVIAEITASLKDRKTISHEMIDRYNAAVSNRYGFICDAIDASIDKLDKSRPFRELVMALKTGKTETYAARHGIDDVIMTVRAITKKIISPQ